MVEAPTKVIMFTAADKEFGGLRDAEECKLPITVHSPAWGRSLGSFVKTKTWKNVFRKDNTVDESSVRSSKGGGDTGSFVVRQDIDSSDIERIENKLEVGSGGCG